MNTETHNTSKNNKLLGIGIFAAATVGFVLYARSRPGKATLPIVYPKDSAIATGRVFQTIYTPQEFELLLSSPVASRGTLFAAFVRLGEVPSNSMATNLWDIVGNDNSKNTDQGDSGAVCVELTGGRNDELARKYMVNTVPSVVALKKTLPFETYTDVKVGNSDSDVNSVDTVKLQEWIKKILNKE